MADELILVFGTPKTLESNGGAISNNAIAQADDGSYGIVADGAYFPHAKFVLAVTFGTAPTENTGLILCARPLNIDSTNNSEVPETTRLGTIIGTFIVNNVTTTQYIELVALDVPWEANYYLFNNATGQSVSSGWTLKVTPFSYKPAAA
jgi:hypothetical protein